MLAPGKPHFLAALVLVALYIPCITTAQEKSGGQYDVLASPYDASDVGNVHTAKQEEIRFQDDVKVLLGRTGFFSPIRMKTLLAEKEEIQNCHQRNQISRERHRENTDQEEDGINQGKPLHFNRNDKEQQHLHIREKRGKGKEHGEINILCREAYRHMGDQINQKSVKDSKNNP